MRLTKYQLLASFLFDPVSSSCHCRYDNVLAFIVQWTCQALGVQDFKARLQEQLGFLNSSCLLYDQGREAEAIRIATCVRVLAYDSPRSTSILSHLGVKDQLGFIDRGPSFPSDPRVITIGFGLCYLQSTIGGTGQETRLSPCLDSEDPQRNHPPVSFDDWWSRTILKDQRDQVFSRKDFVLMAANKDGGAHVDSKLPEAYEALSRNNSVEVGIGPDNRPAGQEIILGSLRHIGFELSETIEHGIDWIENQPTIPEPICPLPLGSETRLGLSRNDKCPCGSGKKVKKCFDRRLPLVPFSINGRQI